MNQVLHTAGIALELHLAVGQALDVEEGLNHARQPLRFGIDHGRHLLAFVLIEVVAPHHFARTLDRGERTAHFVGDEVDGLAVARALDLGLSELAAHDEELVGRCADECQPGGSERR